LASLFASSLICVDLPDPSPPSNDINRGLITN
jgi:hypothetical protein